MSCLDACASKSNRTQVSCIAVDRECTCTCSRNCRCEYDIDGASRVDGERCAAVVGLMEVSSRGNPIDVDDAFAGICKGKDRTVGRVPDGGRIEAAGAGKSAGDLWRRQRIVADRYVMVRGTHRCGVVVVGREWEVCVEVRVGNVASSTDKIGSDDD